jgi:hypothetical protein
LLKRTDQLNPPENPLMVSRLKWQELLALDFIRFG